MAQSHGTARPVDTDLADLHSEAKLYRLDPPLHSTIWGERDVEYVVVYAVFVPVVGLGTYVMAADETGRIVSELELEGSYEGAGDHAEALRRAGYEVA
ncbi:hypothetical protein ACFOYW_16840 [Gryllotalpicola reticulitermitis]|uniref:Transposase n=1 Tax=Gryllotalpicola reticulitermitis TaxID=1184153 RepID=A0ABV8Q9I6_9MICO